MRLSKIQKFFKENNIDYKYSVDTYKNNEFGTITINDDRTDYKRICEITGTNGNTVNEIMIFYKDKITNKSSSFTLTSQNEIIKRLKSDIDRK